MQNKTLGNNGQGDAVEITEAMIVAGVQVLQFFRVDCDDDLERVASEIFQAMAGSDSGTEQK